MAHAEWMMRAREGLVTKYLGKWRRWLFVSVLARQHWVRVSMFSYVYTGALGNTRPNFTISKLW